MGWLIKCNAQCGKQTPVRDIVELIKYHRDEAGWFLCSSCRKRGHIEKRFGLQERGKTWEPYLRGIIPLGADGDTYQPFVFLVSYKPDGLVDGIWFSYYKDLRSTGGKLKLGYGPGGPPVLDLDQVFTMLLQMQKMGCLSQEEIPSAFKNSSTNLSGERPSAGAASGS